MSSSPLTFQRTRTTRSSGRLFVHRSSFIVHRSRRGYTLVELFVTIAVLIIVLGLMIDLANRVRRNSADKLTRQILQQLAALMDNYLDHNAGQLPPIAPLYTAGPVPDEATLQITARRNNADFIRFLRSQTGLTRPIEATGEPIRDDVFAGLPLSLYDEVTLHDPWGSPVVFMPRQSPLFGMAPADRFFFFSAGPDRKYLTREDNLYSYEQGLQSETPPTTEPHSKDSPQ